MSYDMFFFDWAVFLIPPFFLYADFSRVEEIVLMPNAIKDYSVMEQKLEQLCLDAVVQNQLELYDVEYVDHEQTLRLFIENPTTKTATLKECGSVDRALTDAIENADFIGDEFTLEVSSPGVYRHLRTSDHFTKAIGSRAIVYFKSKIDLEGKKEKRIIGIIQEVSDGNVTLNNLEEVKLKNLKISFEDIKKANVEPHWNDIKQ